MCSRGGGEGRKEKDAHIIPFATFTQKAKKVQFSNSFFLNLKMRKGGERRRQWDSPCISSFLSFLDYIAWILSLFQKWGIFLGEKIRLMMLPPPSFWKAWIFTLGWKWEKMKYGSASAWWCQSPLRVPYVACLLSISLVFSSVNQTDFP